MKRTTIMLSEELKMQAEKAARRKRISLGQFIRVSLEKAVRSAAKSGQEDPFFADKSVWRGAAPRDGGAVAESSTRFAEQPMDSPQAPAHFGIRPPMGQLDLGHGLFGHGKLCLFELFERQPLLFLRLQSREDPRHLRLHHPFSHHRPEKRGKLFFVRLSVAHGWSFYPSVRTFSF